MSNDEVSNEGGAAYLADPDASVQNTPEAEFAPLETEAEPRVEPGSVGDEKIVTGQLDGTGLDLIARRVLARRGIDPARLARAPGAGRAALPDGGGALPDILSASTAVAAAPRAARSVVTGPGAVLESVILDADGDGRERVFDTAHFPYRAIASLEITARDGKRYQGTAWFVSDRTLITAGHCVYVRGASASTNGWVRSIRVVPGRNGTASGSEPFGAAVATRFRSVAGWVNDGNPESDYGAILLDDGPGPTGKEVGMFGVGVFGDTALKDLNLNVAGYPADKKGADAMTLWYDVKKTARVTPRQLFYDVDTYGGQSGAPVYVNQGDDRVAVAIHCYGTSATVTSNAGTRITNEVLERIKSWKT